ncbi:MAG: GNVR domain-containing protein [Cyanobacteria bacterium P01_C01_bin.38]
MNKVTAIAFRHWKPVVLWNIFVLGLTGYVATVTPKVWNATTKLTVPGNNGNLNANLGILGSLKNSSPNILAGNSQLEMQQRIITSDTLMESVLEIDPLKDDFGSVSAFKSLFEVIVDEESPILTINVSSSTSELAKIRANNLINLFQKRLNQLRKQNRSSKRQFTKVELNDAKNNLISRQQALAQFKRKNALVDAPEQTKAIVTTIDSLTKSRLEALSQAEYNQNRVNNLSNLLSMSSNQAIRSLSLGENKDYQFLRNKLSELKAEIARKRTKFTDNHPVLVELLQEQQVLLNRLQSQVEKTGNGIPFDTTVSTEGKGRAGLIEELVLAETEASGQKKRAQLIQTQIETLKNNLNSIPNQQKRLIELKRNVDVAEGVYKGLVAQVQQTNIDVFDVYPNVEVLDSPRASNKPVSPKKSLMILNSLLAGMIGSIALILLLERRNPLLSPQDLQDMQFPIVVSIPQFKGAELTWELDDEKQEKFQRLASAISLQPLDNRRLLITSAMEGEGKTTVTLGLGKALVDLGFRVLVVDGDFIRAKLTQNLGFTPQLNMINTVISIEPNLDLLPATPRNGIVRMVSQGQFEQSLIDAQCDSKYDYILVDTAPVSATTATPLMTTQIKNVLFVVKPGLSFTNSVRNSLQQLMQHQANVLGLVVNGVEDSTKPYKRRLNEQLATNDLD